MMLVLLIQTVIFIHGTDLHGLAQDRLLVLQVLLVLLVQLVLLE